MELECRIREKRRELMDFNKDVSLTRIFFSAGIFPILFCQFLLLRRVSQK